MLLRCEISGSKVKSAIICGPLGTKAWRVLRLLIEGSHTGTEGSCEDIE